MKRFQEQKLDKRDHLLIRIFATIMRIVLTPVFLIYRVYLWVWDGTIFETFSKSS